MSRDPRRRISTPCATRWRPSSAPAESARSWRGGRRTRVSLDEEAAASLFKLIEVLEDSDDVQNVYANFEVADDVLERLTRLMMRSSGSFAAMRRARSRPAPYRLGGHRCRRQPAEPCRRRRRPSPTATCRWPSGWSCSDGSAAVIERLRPDEAAVEETFVNKNAASTLKLGVARGVVLLAPAERGLPVAEYSANMVKKSVVGAGHAGKEQVQLMVRRLLPGCAIEAADAADALAVAICHAHHPVAADAGGDRRRMQPGARRDDREALRPARHRSGRTVHHRCRRRRLSRASVRRARCAGCRRCRRPRCRSDRDACARGPHPPFGFIDAAERDWFRLLTTVQGVGARLALAVLSALAPEELALAIAAQDRAALARADGVGPRLAARIVSELHDKVGRRFGPRALRRPPVAGGVPCRPRVTRRDRRCGLGAGQPGYRPRRGLRRGRRGGAPARRRTPRSRR